MKSQAKLALSFLLFMIIIPFSISSEEVDGNHNICLAPASLDQLGGKWGIIDETGSEVVPCEFEELDNVRWGTQIMDPCGLPYIRKPHEQPRFYMAKPSPSRIYIFKNRNNGMGLVDEKGNSQVYDMHSAREIKPGFLHVSTQSGDTIMRYDGSFLFAPGKYGSIEYRLDLIFGQLEGKRGCLNFNCNFKDCSEFGVVENNIDGILVVRKDNVYCFADMDFNYLCAFKYRKVEAFRGGIYAERDGKYYLLNRNIEEIAEIQGVPTGQFVDGLLQVSDGRKVGVIDKTGRWCVPCQFDAVTLTDSQLIVVKSNRVYGIYHKDGTLITEPKYEDIRVLNGGFLYSVGRKWGFCDNNGNIVLEPCFAQILERNIGKYTFFAAESNRKFSLYDFTGKKRGETTYDSAQVEYLRYSEGVYLLRNGSGTILLREDGTLITGDFTSSGVFSNGVAPAIKDGLYGLIDMKGHFISEPRYRCCSDFISGRAYVNRGPKIGYINPEGKFVIPAKYCYAGVFSEGMAAVALTDKLGYIDSSGKLAIDYRYDYALPFRNGKALVQIGEMWGVIDRTGEWVYNPVLKPKYDQKITEDSLKAGYISMMSRYYLVMITSNMDVIETKLQLLSQCQTGKQVNVGEDYLYHFPAKFLGIKTYTNPIVGQGYWRTEYDKMIALFDRKGNMVVPPLFLGFSQGAEGMFVADFSTEIFTWPSIEEHLWNKADEGGILKDGHATIEQCLQFIDNLKKATEASGFDLELDKPEGKSVYRVYLNAKGEIAFPKVFERARDFSCSRAAVFRDEKWGYIDQTGEFILEPEFGDKYTEPASYSDDAVLVWKGNSCFFYDTSGERLSFTLRIPNEDFDTAFNKYQRGTTSFVNGLAIVNAGYWFTVTRDGRRTYLHRAHVNYLGIPDVFSYSNPHSSLLGLCDSKGLHPSEAIYEKIEYIGGNVVKVQSKTGYGLVSFSGNVKIPPEYWRIEYMQGGGFRIANGMKVFFTDDNGVVSHGAKFGFLGIMTNTDRTFVPPNPRY